MANRKDKSVEETSEEFSTPLDEINLPVVNRDGTQKVVPAINIGFMEPRSYVKYKVLPCLIHPYVGDYNDAEIEEWMERMSLIEESLNWLLKLTHQRFWCQVIYDEQLHIALQTYLSRAPRDYDLNLSARQDVLDCQKRVHKLVFLVILRMSTYKESKSHHISPEVFAELIYENYIFDVPRMMDISVLYGFENQQIISKMIQSFFTSQPCYLDDLEDSLSMALSAFDIITKRLNLKLHGEVKEKAPLKLKEQDISKLQSLPIDELLDIVNFVIDTCATLYCFLDASVQACAAFYKCSGPLHIPPFYDLIFPLLEKEVISRTKSGQPKVYVDAISKKLVYSKSFLVKAFRSTVTASCIHPVLNARCETADDSDNSDSFHLENYLHLFTEVATEKVFLNDYNKLFPISSDVELFSAAGVQVDMTSLNYILGSIQYSSVNGSHISEGATSQNSISHSTLRTENIAQGNITSSSEVGAIKNGDSDFYAENASCAKPDEVQLTSLIHAILELFPDYGEGFLEACLEYYGFDCEKVIDAFFTNNLPPHLDKIDRSTKRKVPKPVKNKELDSYLSGRKSIFDGDEFDVFSRDDVSMDKIHKGKSGKTPSGYKDLNSDKNSSMLKALTLMYEEQFEIDEERAREEFLAYEDEYDDTYDSHAVGLMEAQPENELLRLRPMKVPAALKALQKQKSNDGDEQEDGEGDAEEEEDEEEENYNEIIGPLLSGPTKKEDFCVDPAYLREKAEERLQSMKKLHPNRGGQPSTQNYKNKEKNKSRVANHNRKKQSDYKQSRGMFGK